MVKVRLFARDEGADLSAFWLNFGSEQDPGIRKKMIYLAIREVALVGPGSFNTASVCDALNITYPMVNHYFGNRDGLVAEAGFNAYQLYVERLWENVKLADPEPEQRLRMWIRAQVELTGELGGWGAVLNYAPFSHSIFQILEQRFGPQRQALFELNVARLAQLIKDYRENRLTTVDYTIDDYPRDEVLEDQRLTELTFSISVSTLGMAIWRAGGHIPSRGISELKDIESALIEAHVENLLKLAKN